MNLSLAYSVALGINSHSRINERKSDTLTSVGALPTEHIDFLTG